MVGGMHGRGCVWQGGMCDRGHAWQGNVCGGGACMAGGHVWQVEVHAYFLLNNGIITGCKTKFAKVIVFIQVRGHAWQGA